MRLHRFFIPPQELQLEHHLWVTNEHIRNQWLKVLRYREGDQVVLFDGMQHERLYRIKSIQHDAVELDLVTEMSPISPQIHIYVFFSLLKKDKNDWVLQKCTELGVKNFVPILAERSEKTGFNSERAEKIVIEAAEQCGRADIPNVREPILLETALEEFNGKVSMFVCDETVQENKPNGTDKPLGLFIGPEGGWTDHEKYLFKISNVGHFNLGIFTLRAETAAVVAASKLLQ